MGDATVNVSKDDIVLREQGLAILHKGEPYDGFFGIVAQLPGNRWVKSVGAPEEFSNSAFVKKSAKVDWYIDEAELNERGSSLENALKIVGGEMIEMDPATVTIEYYKSVRGRGGKRGKSKES